MLLKRINSKNELDLAREFLICRDEMETIKRHYAY